MRWSTLKDDDAKVTALADLLLGAAAADGHYDRAEVVAVTGALMKTLGVVALPESLVAHIRAFDPAALDVAAAIARLGLAGAPERQAVLKLVARVVHADREVHDAERAYLLAVAAALDLERNDVDAALHALAAAG